MTLEIRGKPRHFYIEHGWLKVDNKWIVQLSCRREYHWKCDVCRKELFYIENSVYYSVEGTMRFCRYCLEKIRILAEVSK